jgi:SNF2 family DNA or RNA helicase
MRERVAYLIDQKVERRVREFMDEFRQEIYAELAEQKRQNEEHITYYAQ